MNQRAHVSCLGPAEVPAVIHPFLSCMSALALTLLSHDFLSAAQALLYDDIELGKFLEPQHSMLPALQDPA